MKRKTFLYSWCTCFGALATLCAAGAAAESEEPDHGPQRNEPIRVHADEMRSLSIVQLVLRADYTSDIRVASDGLLAALAKDVKDLGYNVLGASDASVFDSNDPNKAEMQLGGTINHLTCERNRNYREISTCNIAVAWELFDTRKSKVVYKVLTRSRREVSLNDNYLDEEVKNLFAFLMSRGNPQDPSFE